MPQILKEKDRIPRSRQEEARGDAECAPGHEEEARRLNVLFPPVFAAHKFRGFSSRHLGVFENISSLYSPLTC